MTRAIFCLFGLLICSSSAAQEDKVKKGAESIDGWGQLVDPDGGCQVQLDDKSLQLQFGSGPRLLDSENSGLMNSPRVVQSLEGDFAIQVVVGGNLPLAELDQIKIGQPNSVVLRILRAIALREAAKVRTSSDSRRTALDESLLEFESVAPLMPSNRFLQTHYLNTLSNRIQLLKQQQDMESESNQRFTKLSVQGNQIALRLEQEMKSEPFTRVDRATFYSTVGQNAKFRQITLSGSEGATASRQSRAAELFKLREYDRLHRFLEEHEYAWATNVYHAFATIETATDTASRQQAANKAFTKVFDSHDHAYGNDVLALEVFLLAGNRQALRENANRLSKNKPPSFEWHMYQRTLELFQTELSEDDLRDYLRYAEPFNEECSYAYYVAGLVVMTRGSLDDRELAKSYFQRCLQAGKFDWWSHVWADAFLSRLQEGDNWPAWIQGHHTDTH